MSEAKFRWTDDGDFLKWMGSENLGTDDNPIDDDTLVLMHRAWSAGVTHMVCEPVWEEPLLAAASVFHHDDGCQERLNGGFCPKCKFVPDMQSTAIHYYCPVCVVPLTGLLKCATCGGRFSPPNRSG